MSNMFYGATKPIFQRAEDLRKNPTHEEFIVWQHLKANQLGVRFKRQHPIWLYVADFYCHQLKLVIEVDGSIHEEEETKRNDKVREKDIAFFGIKLVRFKNKQVITNIEKVIDSIRLTINDLKRTYVYKEVSK